MRSRANTSKCSCMPPPITFSTADLPARRCRSMRCTTISTTRWTASAATLTRTHRERLGLSERWWSTHRCRYTCVAARWRSRELWTARQFRACWGSSLAEIEDLYDATIAVLVEKDEPYESPEHLRAALHRGIKLRALRLHRDREVHEKALRHAAPAMETAGRDRAWREEPERALLAREDDAIVGEFTDLERQVFTLVANGRSWRAIATTLGLPETEARTLTRTCERKRSRFLTLYETGRLCGYRSQTIGSLLSGKENSERAVGQAFAHLRHCHACQLRHKTDAVSLRAAFDARVLSVLPVYADSHTSLLDQLQATVSRVARLFQRASTPQAGIRDRALEIAAGTSAGAKLAAGIAGVILLAGGAVGVATSSQPARHRNAPQRTAVVHALIVPPTTLGGRAVLHKPPAARLTSHRLPRPNEQHTPGGFSYLGTSPPPTPRTKDVPVVKQRGGSPFGP